MSAPLKFCLLLSGLLIAAAMQAQGVVQVVRTSVPDVDVYVDGRRVGSTGDNSALDIDLTPGQTYVVRVEKEGFITDQRRVSASGVSEDILFDLRAQLPPVVPPLSDTPPSQGGFADWLRENVLTLVLGVLLLLIVALVLALAWLVILDRRRGRGGGSSGRFPLPIPPVRPAPIGGFDRYDLLRQIGRGGMATVYFARDRHLGQTVALKVMDAGLLGDADLVRKFIREGETLQRIAASFPDAPVVRALRYGREHGDEEGRPFVALEYLDGRSLLQVLRRRGRLPLPRAIAIARQVAEGLAAAHAHGVWHRDVSPDNVIVVGAETDAPTVRLIDFGVAKNEYTLVHTLDGSITGKPAYMSPEQCRGDALDGRSDLYALGALLYALLTGHPPFTHRNPLLVMRMHESNEVPPLPETVPPAVRDLVQRLLSKRREDRPSSALSVANELGHLERELYAAAHVS